MTEKNSDSENVNDKIVNIINCEVCNTNQFKYKCPRCLLKTCCLICVKEHKKKNKCSGQKDKFNTATSLINFGEKELIQDIKFLNNAFTVTNTASKKVYNMTDDEEKREKEKKNKYNRKCARKFRNLTLLNSPMIMTRFSENKSYIDYKNKKFFWTIKFIFIISEDKKYEHIFKETFDDSLIKINDIIDYLYSNKHELELPLLMFINSYVEDELKNSQILYRLNLKEMDKNLIKGKLVKNNKVHYEECDKSCLLKDLLIGKEVLEYPEFYVMIDK